MNYCKVNKQNRNLCCCISGYLYLPKSQSIHNYKLQIQNQLHQQRLSINFIIDTISFIRQLCGRCKMLIVTGTSMECHCTWLRQVKWMETFAHQIQSHHVALSQAMSWSCLSNSMTQSENFCMFTSVCFITMKISAKLIERVQTLPKNRDFIK